MKPKDTIDKKRYNFLDFDIISSENIKFIVTAIASKNAQVAYHD